MTSVKRADQSSFKQLITSQPSEAQRPAVEPGTQPTVGPLRDGAIQQRTGMGATEQAAHNFSTANAQAGKIGKQQLGVLNLLSESGGVAKAGAPEVAPADDKGWLDHAVDFGRGFKDGAVDTAKGLGTMAVGAWKMTAGFAYAPKEAKATWGKVSDTARAVASNPKAVLQAIAEPYKEAWSEGRPMEAIGRGSFEVVALVATTKGLDKLGKLAKGSKAAQAAASSADDVARTGNAAQKVAGMSDDVARAGTAAHKTAGLSDDVARVGAKTVKIVDTPPPGMKLGAGHTWKLDAGVVDDFDKINLITPKQLEKIPAGTRLFDINGKAVIKGVDAIDLDTRGGMLAYGFRADKVAGASDDVARAGAAAVKVVDTPPPGMHLDPSKAMQITPRGAGGVDKINLITPKQLQQIPDGTRLYSINGRSVIKGVDAIDLDTRGGKLAFGFRADKVAGTSDDIARAGTRISSFTDDAGRAHQVKHISDAGKLTDKVDDVASQLHDAWRAPRKLGNGKYEARWKDIPDWDDIPAGAVTKRVDGKLQLDIANTSYKNLHPSWQAENHASAAHAVGVVNDAAKQGAKMGDDFVEAASSKVHDAWLARPNNSWAKGGELDVPFTQLSVAEAAKDREIVRVALRVLASE